VINTFKTSDEREKIVKDKLHNLELKLAINQATEAQKFIPTTPNLAPGLYGYPVMPGSLKPLNQRSSTENYWKRPNQPWKKVPSS
jgi:hypothetical protein